MTTNPGFGNFAVNAGNKDAVVALGHLNTAFNLGGSGNIVATGNGAQPATLSMAFSVLGTKNTVSAGPGPLVIAGALGGPARSSRKPVRVSRSNR
ncbi:MAG TPA: hypothetical protein VMU34_08930 [Mycobacterium sp.]|nr:hypothetical protein [Mycobacterium sp.]